MKKAYLTPALEMHSINAVSSLMVTSIRFGGDATTGTVVDVKANEWANIWEKSDK